MAVITATHISLYSLATRSRVWHKPVADSSAGKPSSLQFCESNILVGRNNNKTYELVQLHPNHAILSTIELIAPSPNPANLHYSQAIYDSANSILWMAAFARGSLFGFRYSLKGQPPVRDASVSPVSAFDEMIEMPLDSIVSMVSCAGPAGPEIFYATPQGFTKATIDPALFNLFGLLSTTAPGKAPQPDRAPAPVPAGPGPAHGPGKSTNGDKKDNKAGPKAKHIPKGLSPAPPAPEPAAAVETTATDEKPDARALAQADTAPKPSNAAASAPAEFATLLKQVSYLLPLRGASADFPDRGQTVESIQAESRDSTCVSCAQARADQRSECRRRSVCQSRGSDQSRCLGCRPAGAHEVVSHPSEAAYLS
jgi:hypothetical protein